MLRVLVVVCVVFSTVGAQAATPPSEHLLPGSTQGWLSIPSVAATRAAFNRTQFGQLLADPALAGFIDDVKGEIRAARDRRGSALELSLDDLEQIATGETTIAMVAPTDGNGMPGRVVLIDVTGREGQAAQLVDQVVADLLRRGANEAAFNYANIAMRRITQGSDERLVVFQHQGLLCLARNARIAQEVAARLVTPANAALPRLAADPAYRYVQQRLAADPGADRDPEHLSWFVKPLGYAEAVRALRPQREDLKDEPRSDLLESLRATGFEALQGAGGRISLAGSQYDAIQRIAIFAPHRGQWRDSMNVLSLVNGTELEAIPAWIPAGLGSSIAVQIDVQRAFDHVGPLFDRVKGGPNSKGLWERTLRRVSSRRPGSPGVDIRTQIVARLGQQAYIITDNKPSAAGQLLGPNDERLLFAMPIAALPTDAGVAQAQAQVADGIARILAPDTKHVRREDHLVPGQVIWTLLRDRDDGRAELDDVRIEFNGQVNVQQAPEMVELEPAAVCVAHGYLFYATHLSMMGDILNNVAAGNGPGPSQRPSLAKSENYNTVMAAVRQEAARRNWNQTCLVRFAQTNEELRATYELLQQKQLRNSQSLIARSLRTLPNVGTLEDDEADIDVRQLPNYNRLRDYLQPSGQVGRAEEHGWFIVAFTLPGQRPSDSANRSGNTAGMRTGTNQR